MWTLAGGDPARADHVATLDLRLGLEGYAHAMRKLAMEQHRHDVLVWAMTAPHVKRPGEPPRLPDWVTED